MLTKTSIYPNNRLIPMILHKKNFHKKQKTTPDFL